MNNIEIVGEIPTAAETITELLIEQHSDERQAADHPELLSHRTSGEDTFREIVDSWLTDDDIFILYARCNKEVIGYITTQVKCEKYGTQNVKKATILGVYVHLTARRLGVARRLLVKVEKLCAYNDIQSIDASWVSGNFMSSSLFIDSGYILLYSTARKVLNKQFYFR